MNTPNEVINEPTDAERIGALTATLDAMLHLLDHIQLWKPRAIPTRMTFRGYPIDTQKAFALAKVNLEKYGRYD